LTPTSGTLEPLSTPATQPFHPDCPECPERPYLRVFKSTVYVSDHDRSLDFYVNRLGFSVLADIAGTYDGRWVAIAPPDGQAILALVAPKPGTDKYRLIGRETQIGFISEDINITYELWQKHGVRFHQPPQQTIFGITFARFQDIDGNGFELIGTDQFTRQIEQERHIAAAKVESDRRTTQELEIARQVQARLFPQTLPPLKTLDYAGICIQARHVGGDYYDFLALGNQRLGLVISDIAGKGIAAALLMANLQANLRSQFALARDEPQLFLSPSTASSSRTPPTALTPLSSSPTTTTPPAASATPTAATSPRFSSAAMARSSASTPPPRSSDSSKSGNPPPSTASSPPAISSPSTPTASPKPSANPKKSSAKTASSPLCVRIQTSHPRRSSPPPSTRSSASALTSRTTTSPSSSPNAHPNQSKR
jgi:catechol 2,3-dioxygenase-like lactoylglutathione lyase family enzyme